MAFIPGSFSEVVSGYGWTSAQKIAYITLSYLVIVVYGFLLILLLRNIWAILLKQKEYKNLPISAFYCFALIAVTLRPIYIVWQWTPNPIISNIDWVQQGAKLCVGLVQDWITIELAIRIHNAKGHSDISEAGKRKLRRASAVLFAIVALAFCTFSILVFARAHKDGDHG